jgi:glycerophosphoryl diester phosphodiesterase
VIHDLTLDRTTDASGPVAARTMAELRRLDAGGGQPIPRLEEVLELARGFGAGVVVEVKVPPAAATAGDARAEGTGVEPAVVARLGAAGMLAECAVISFDHPTVARIKALAPGLATGALVMQPAADAPALLAALAAEIYSPHWSQVDLAAVEAVHRAGGAVAVWTVDDADTLGRVARLGVDAIFTNRPRALLDAATG